MAVPHTAVSSLPPRSKHYILTPIILPSSEHLDPPTPYSRQPATPAFHLLTTTRAPTTTSLALIDLHQTNLTPPPRYTPNEERAVHVYLLTVIMVHSPSVIRSLHPPTFDDPLSQRLIPASSPYAMHPYTSRPHTQGPVPSATPHMPQREAITNAPHSSPLRSPTAHVGYALSAAWHSSRYTDNVIIQRDWVHIINIAVCDSLQPSNSASSHLRDVGFQNFARRTV
ncbi:hypothetical protein L227DRAFT_613216, partial [Lentinus tigrinus ALCF2SS1-6]